MDEAPAIAVDPRTPLLPTLAGLPGHLYWRASARVAASAAAALPPEVDPHAHVVLLALPPGAAHSQQELADRVLLSRQTLVHTAAGLAARGYVDRRRNPADRRSYVLTRTAAGTAAVERWADTFDRFEDHLLTDLTAAERTEFVALLLAVVRGALPDGVPLEARASAAFLITRGHALMHRAFLAALGPLGLEPRDFGSLLVLRDLGAVPQSGLARTMGVSGPTVVEIVDRLEERGLVVRTTDPHDRRARLLRTTTAAPRTLRSALRSVHAIDRDLLGPLGEPGRARLVELLRRFVVAPA